MPADDPAETHKALHEISLLLRTGLDQPALTELVRLIEYGVNPDALAKMVVQLRKDQ